MIWAISLYNRLVSLKNNRENAFADIDVQLKLRFDLVENLVNTVKGYATHEKETLQNLTDARTSFLHANGVEGKLETNNQLTGALKTLFAVAENYPELKANQNSMDLQTQLEGTENRIAVERKRYNEAVQSYNVYIRQFPRSIIANMNGFREKAYFKADDQASTAPKVNF